ncbi:GNAT family N-acetyltransferase [candidate division KSB1 bacterium]|nr:GNAT family N-acetyltransferase [candidate division KSB1 bacterium]
MIEIRSVEKSDLETLKEFWNQNVVNDPLTVPLLEEKFQGDPDYDPALNLIAVANSQIVSFMQGVVRGVPQEKRGWIKLFATDKNYRRQGLATQLLKQIENEMVQQGVSRIGMLDSAPNYLQPGIDPFYTAAVAFVERHGFKRCGDTSNLKAVLKKLNLDTQAEEAEALKRGITIRRAVEADRPIVTAFLERYFLAWVYEVSNMFQNSPISLHLAFMGDELVAFSGHNGNNFNTGWFGPMGTNPRKRGLGIGGVLLKRCLNDTKLAGFEYSIIPWVGPIPFYMHYADAHVCRVFWRYEKKLNK